jgi:hypothetical protein
VSFDPARVLAQIGPEALAADCLAYVAVKSETGHERPGSDCFVDLFRRSGWPVALEEVAPG